MRGIMDKKSSIIIAVILALAVIVFIVVSFQKSSLNTKSDTASTTEWVNTPAEPSPEDPLTTKTIITAKHAYKNGIHTVAGEIPLPTPCHVLESSVSASADKQKVFIELLSSIKSGEMCAQVVTPARFKVSVPADAGATISMTLKRKPRQLRALHQRIRVALYCFLSVRIKIC
jgi:hypothetical protein